MWRIPGTNGPREKSFSAWRMGPGREPERGRARRGRLEELTPSPPTLMAENPKFFYHQVSIKTAQELLKTQDILKKFPLQYYVILKSQNFNHDDDVTKIRKND